MRGRRDILKGSEIWNDLQMNKETLFLSKRFNLVERRKSRERVESFKPITDCFCLVSKLDSDSFLEGKPNSI